MAIAPIDLQTLFTQVDKVGRSQAAAREGAAIQQSIQGIEIQRKAEELLRQVNETQNTGEGVEKAGDQNRKYGSGAKNDKKKSGNKEDDEDNPDKRAVLSNPSLGRKIDISL